MIDTKKEREKYSTRLEEVNLLLEDVQQRKSQLALSISRSGELANNWNLLIEEEEQALLTEKELLEASIAALDDEEKSRAEQKDRDRHDKALARYRAIASIAADEGQERWRIKQLRSTGHSHQADRREARLADLPEHIFRESLCDALHVRTGPIAMGEVSKHDPITIAAKAKKLIMSGKYQYDDLPQFAYIV